MFLCRRLVGLWAFGRRPSWAPHGCHATRQRCRAAQLWQMRAVTLQDASCVDTITATDAGTAGAPSKGLDTAGEQPQQYLSKSKMKKMKKQQRYEERRAEKKAARLEAAKSKREAKKDEFDHLTEQEKEEKRAASRACIEDRRKQAAERQRRLEKAMDSGPKLAIDLHFQDYMTDREVRSLVQQLNYSYSCVTKAARPFHLVFTGVTGTIKDHLDRQSPGRCNWRASFEAANMVESFKQDLSKVVYLTADSDNVLGELEEDKIYVIGGIVDRNRYKRLCLDRAGAAGVPTARLPVADNVKLMTSKVLTVNQVVEIMSKRRDVGDWKAAFECVIPSRKRAGKGEADGMSEESRGEDASPPSPKRSKGEGGA